MSFELFKLLAALVILIAALGSGLIPLWLGVSQRGQRILTFGIAFASGVFLAAGLIHLLGDGLENFASLGMGEGFPLAQAVCGSGFLLILLIEKVLAGDENPAVASAGQSYMLLAILSVHSVIAGVSLGLEGSVGAFGIILLAILAHKGFAAFSLGISFFESGMARSRFRNLLLFFSMTTPIGVGLGAIASKYLQSDTAVLFEAGFDSLAAGTFIYVATMDLMSESFGQKTARRGKFLAVLTGFGLMALLALWI